MLTLRKLLETVGRLRPPVEVAIETKHPTRYGGLVEKRVAELLHNFGWDTRERRPAGAGDELHASPRCSGWSGWLRTCPSCS